MSDGEKLAELWTRVKYSVLFLFVWGFFCLHLKIITFRPTLVHSEKVAPSCSRASTNSFSQKVKKQKWFQCCSIT